MERGGCGDVVRKIRNIYMHNITYSCYKKSNNNEHTHIHAHHTLQPSKAERIKYYKKLRREK